WRRGVRPPPNLSPMAHPQHSNAAKRRDVLALLHDPAWSQRSNREIARQAGVHHQLVARLRQLDESSTAPHPESAPAQSQPSRTALRIAEGLVSLGLAPSAAQRLLTHLQALPPGKRRAAERLLEALLL